MGNCNYTGWFIQLFDKRKGTHIDDDAGVVNVLTAGSPVEAIIYSDVAGTVKANPITFSNGYAFFYTLKTVTSVDLSILTAAGDAFFIGGNIPGETRIEVDTHKREQLLVIPFAASNSVEVDTGFDLPVNMLVEGVLLKVTTVDASETVDFGILSSESGGDANGFVTLASVATAGYVELKPQITGGTNIDYVGANFIGALLCTSIAGADAVATVGGFTQKRHRADGTAKSLSYTGSAGSDTAAGYLMLVYMKLI